jgi:hypothetical protein
MRLKHTEVHTTIEDYGAKHCETPVCTDTLVYIAGHTLAALCVVSLLNEDIMELNLAVANICDGRGEKYKTLDASLYCTTKSDQWHLSTFRCVNKFEGSLSDAHELFREMCHYVRLYVQSAGEKRAIMSTVSFLSDLLERVTCCYLRCGFCTNFVFMEQWESSLLFKMF